MDCVSFDDVKRLKLGYALYGAKLQLSGVEASIELAPPMTSRDHVKCYVKHGNSDCRMLGKSFEGWLESKREWFTCCWPLSNMGVTYYGMWCGPGLSNPDHAVSSIPSKFFAIYCAVIDGVKVYDPAVWERYTFNVPETFSVPWLSEINVNFQANEQQFSRLLKSSEDDSISREMFNVSGKCSGITLFPLSNKKLPCFSLLTESKHSDIPEAQVDSISDYLTMSLLEKHAAGMEINIANTQRFVNNVVADVLAHFNPTLSGKIKTQALRLATIWWTRKCGYRS